MKDDFVKIHRRIKSHPVYKNAECFRIFVGFILDAAWGDYTITVDGENRRLQRGQLITSRKELINDLGISGRSLDRYMKLLEIKFDVIQKINFGKKYFITVKNYDFYQKKRMLPK